VAALIMFHQLSVNMAYFERAGMSCITYTLSSPFTTCGNELVSKLQKGRAMP